MSITKLFSWSSIKFLISSFLLLFCCFLLFAAFFGNNLTSIQNSALKQEVMLGLDLRGGVQLLLEVDFDKCLADKLNLLCQDIKKVFNKEGIDFLDIYKEGNNVCIRTSHDLQKITKKIKSLDRDLALHADTLGDSKIIKVSYDASFCDQLLDETMERSMETIRRRVDAFGTKEPTLQKQGNRALLIQVPGIKDLSSLKSIIGKTAQLSFHLMIDAQDQSKGIASKSILFGSQLCQIGFLPLITGDLLTDACVQFIEGRPVVAFSFNSIGARIFGDVTRSYKGRQLAIVLDNELISAPVINDHIPGGAGIISGNFNIDTAQELALLLKAGALPAPLKIIEEKVIGPSLGEDSLVASKISGLIAMITVSLLMIWCYGFLGLVATFALFATVIYILATLILFQITLTLPGIAGIILTLGMAVDSNILVYEHIREELRGGMSSLSAVKRGFKISYKTILDANLTSLIAAVLLYIFGIGAVKGFAVTFGLGIFVSMFTCFWISQPLVSSYYRRRLIKA